MRSSSLISIKHCNLTQRDFFAKLSSGNKRFWGTCCVRVGNAGSREPFSSDSLRNNWSVSRSARAISSFVRGSKFIAAV